LNGTNLTFSCSKSSRSAGGSEVAVPGLLCAGVEAVILFRPFPSIRRRVALCIFATRRSLLYSVLLPKRFLTHAIFVWMKQVAAVQNTGNHKAIFEQ
jgi:hypothetical protein